MATQTPLKCPKRHIETGSNCWLGYNHTGSCDYSPLPPPASVPATVKSQLRGYTSAERKAMPLYSGVLMYFPDALMAVARLSKAGNAKHNPGGPLHWARSKSTDHMDCVARHAITPSEVDPETGEVELVAAAWRLLAALQLREEKRLVAAGIKPLSGVVPS